MSQKSAISRREFLKGAAALGTATAGVSLFPSRVSAFEAATKPVTDGNVQWKASFCSACHKPTCATKVKLVNGVVVGIEGDPASPTNKGKLCSRGLALPMFLYNPYRVKAPMKRTNPKKGLDEDPGWMEISWEEALNIVGEKLKDARETDPRSLLCFRGFGCEEAQMLFFPAFGTPNMLATMGPLCPEHFAGLHMSGTILDRLDLERCNYVLLTGRTFGGGFVTADSGTEHLVDAVERGMKIVCVDPRSNHREAQLGEWVPIRPGTDFALAASLVYTIIHEIGQYDEWWLKVRSNAPYLIPDTEEYLDNTRVFMEDYVRDPDTKKPLVWDTEAGGPVPFDHSKGETYALEGNYEVNGQKVKTCFQALKDYCVQFTPDWASELTTIPAAKIREIAGDLVKEARIGETITIDGYEFPYSPACVNIGRGGVTNRLGTQTYKFYCAVNVLLGNTDVPGGMQGCQNMSQKPWLTANEDGLLVTPFQFRELVVGRPFKFPPDNISSEWLYPMQQGATPQAWKAILDPEKYYINYPIKMALIHASNPIMSNANYEEVVAAFQKIPFTATIAYHFDEPAQLSDVLLPKDSTLENVGIYNIHWNEKECTDENRGLMGTMAKRPAVERVYNTRDSNDIYIQLAKRCGILPRLYGVTNYMGLWFCYNFDPTKPEGLARRFALNPRGEYTWEEIVDRKIKTQWDGKADLGSFENSAIRPYRLPTIKETYNYYYAPGNAVRQHIYFQLQARTGKKHKDDLLKIGVKLPGWNNIDELTKHFSAFGFWYESVDHGVTREYPFKAINWKIHFTTTSNHAFVENPWLQEIIDTSTSDMKAVLIHPESAKKVMVREGDFVTVESQWGGKTQGKVHITNLIHPECVGIPGVFGRKGLHMNPISWEGPSFNTLVTSDTSAVDPVSLSLPNSPRVKLYKV